MRAINFNVRLGNSISYVYGGRSAELKLMGGFLEVHPVFIDHKILGNENETTQWVCVGNPTIFLRVRSTTPET